jgi:hypothetical protein
MSRSIDAVLSRLAVQHPSLQRTNGSADELRTITEELGVRLPKWFSRLLLRYSWDDEFVLDGIRFLPRPAGPSLRPWRDGLFQDAVLASVLVAHGFIQIGRPDTLSYDPISLNTRAMRGHDCPVVVVDHEAALVRNEVHIIEELFASTRLLLSSGDGA